MHSRLQAFWVCMTGFLTLAILLRLSTSISHSEQKGHPILETRLIGDVERITLQSEKATVDLKKQANGLWVLQSDNDFPALSNKVTSLLDVLGYQKLVQKIAVDEKDLASLGLKSPSKLIAYRKGAEPLTVELGALRAGNGQYIRVQGEAYLIERQIKPDFASSDWAYSNLWEIPLEKVVAIATRNESASQLTLKQAKQQWELQPNRGQLDPAALNEFLERARHLALNDRFFIETSKISLPAQPELVLEVETVEGGIYQAQFYRRTDSNEVEYLAKISRSSRKLASELGEVPAHWSRWYFQIETGVVDILKRKPSDLLQKKSPR